MKQLDLHPPHIRSLQVFSRSCAYMFVRFFALSLGQAYSRDAGVRCCCDIVFIINCIGQVNVTNLTSWLQQTNESLLYFSPRYTTRFAALARR